MAEVILGTQGWVHPSWVGSFYPAGTQPGDMLSHYSRLFDTVEIESTFYEMPGDPLVRDWRDAVPDGFVFSARVPNRITHELRLVDVSRVLGKFLRRMELLGDKLGPLVLQLPPNLPVNETNWARLQNFVLSLPEDFKWVVEFRNESWFTEEVLQILSHRNVALALVDGQWIRPVLVADAAKRPTADFLYVRWLGLGEPLLDHSHVQTERAQDISRWAGILWPMVSHVCKLYGYFSNNFEGHAPHSVRVFQRMMGLRPVDPQTMNLVSGGRELSQV